MVSFASVDPRACVLISQSLREEGSEGADFGLDPAAVVCGVLGITVDGTSDTGIVVEREVR